LESYVPSLGTFVLFVSFVVQNALSLQEGAIIAPAQGVDTTNKISPRRARRRASNKRKRNTDKRATPVNITDHCLDSYVSSLAIFVPFVV